MTRETPQYRLYRTHTLAELTEMMNAILADKRPQPNSIYLYDKIQRRKTDSIAWAITFHLQQKKVTA